MPTYQYRCHDCGYEFEEFQSMTEDAISVCPECKGHTRRLITGGAGLLFKGSGFYITDYRSSQYKADKRKDVSGSSSSSSGSTESKPDTKKASTEK
jgi:putative FmdB family regulatory protein